jgi:hypothetical protein
MRKPLWVEIKIDYSTEYLKGKLIDTFGVVV